MITIHGIPATPWQLRSLERGQLKAIVLPLLPEPMKVGRHLWVLRCRPTDLFWGDSEVPSKKLLKKLKHQIGDRIYLQERWVNVHWGNDQGYIESYIYFTESKVPEAEHYGWQPAETMPQAAAQHWLEITSVRVVQMIDLTLEDYASTGLNDANSAKNSSDSIWDRVTLAAKRWDAAYPQHTWDGGDRWVVLLEVSACSAPD
jgi:hypothetical protein